ncbi:hypothetical protein OG563_33765 [Nocardia vinacea]|uniref:Uncharacterized protein n=1 Tax=Nocardia vinacea TaxID=96468 RepID=A0ABZ1YLK7_9NOCA|nr:hypothetical protein [Nocardia vinacea]
MVAQFDTAAGRERLMAAIDPGNATAHHALLRSIFQSEMDDRRAAQRTEYFENLYWCAFLLYLIGDPSDVPMMWCAKHVDFDTACGFDIQFLLGAGVQPTLSYLADRGHADIVAELSAYSELTDGLGDWEAFRRDYFYGSHV